MKQVNIPYSLVIPILNLLNVIDEKTKKPRTVCFVNDR